MEKMEDIVWLYSVIDTTNMTADELQERLQRFSDGITYHDVCHSDGTKMVIRYQSALNRNAHFEQLAKTKRRLSMLDSAAD